MELEAYVRCMQWLKDEGMTGGGGAQYEPGKTRHIKKTRKKYIPDFEF